MTQTAEAKPGDPKAERIPPIRRPDLGGASLDMINAVKSNPLVKKNSPDESPRSGAFSHETTTIQLNSDGTVNSPHTRGGRNHFAGQPITERFVDETLFLRRDDDSPHAVLKASYVEDIQTGKLLRFTDGAVVIQSVLKVEGEKDKPIREENPVGGHERVAQLFPELFPQGVPTASA